MLLSVNINNGNTSASVEGKKKKNHPHTFYAAVKAWPADQREEDIHCYGRKKRAMKFWSRLPQSEPDSYQYKAFIWKL